MNLRAIAEETVAALELGDYLSPSGHRVDIAGLVMDCQDATQCYEPDALADIREMVIAQPPRVATTHFEVVNETTLQGCTRLLRDGGRERVVALNFASAKNPGGGFLSGARAQEESLARSSALYKSLLQCPDYYRFHRQQRTSLYSDRMIYSPRCPVFRTDDGEWLDEPYLVDCLTSPAPNAGAIQRNEPHNSVRLASTLRERSSKALALAAHHGCDVLVLGAWGCGAFRNDSRLVADIFAAHLKPGGPFWGRFPTVVFSVYDTSRSRDIYAPFASQFADNT